MALNKIVVKFQNGEIIKGWTTDFNVNKDSFYLRPLEEYGNKPLEITISSLKAIFFVKDFIGNKDYKKVRTFEGQPTITPSQRKIIVNFEDGEHLYGTCHSFNKNRKGVFVYPIDPEDNNERIFAVHSAIESIHLAKFNSEEFEIFKKGDF